MKSEITSTFDSVIYLVAEQRARGIKEDDGERRINNDELTPEGALVLWYASDLGMLRWKEVYPSILKTSSQFVHHPGPLALPVAPGT
jgi:hypothetical protein